MLSEVSTGCSFGTLYSSLVDSSAYQYVKRMPTQRPRTLSAVHEMLGLVHIPLSIKRVRSYPTRARCTLQYVHRWWREFKVSWHLCIKCAVAALWIIHCGARHRFIYCEACRLSHISKGWLQFASQSKLGFTIPCVPCLGPTYFEFVSSPIRAHFPERAANVNVCRCFVAAATMPT